MVVVVAEHRDDGDGKLAASVRENEGLGGITVRGEIAREEDHVRVGLHRGEGTADAVSQGRGAVQVAYGSDPDWSVGHVDSSYPARCSANPQDGYWKP